MKARFLAGIFMVAGSLANVAIAGDYSNGFEDDTFCWVDATRVASGAGTLLAPSATGGWHSEAAPGAFTRLGGYGDGDTCVSESTTLTFPEGGYTTSLDIYLEVDGEFSNGALLDFTSAINDAAGSHRRDFIFNCGWFNDDQTDNGLGSGNRYICSASNNVPGWPNNPAREPTVITMTSGWFTFTHEFMDDGNGALSVNLTIADAAGNAIKTWTLNDPSDIINSTVGGNRYSWFATNELGTIAIDNSLRNSAKSGTTAPVPTLGQLALIILAALMLFAGFRRTRKQA